MSELNREQCKLRVESILSGQSDLLDHQEELKDKISKNRSERNEVIRRIRDLEKKQTERIRQRENLERDVSSMTKESKVRKRNPKSKT